MSRNSAHSDDGFFSHGEPHLREPALDLGAQGHYGSAAIQAPPPVPIFISVPRGNSHLTHPSLLARFFGLDVWGEFLMTARTRFEMDSAALLLAAVFLFELLAWTMLFYQILHAAEATWWISFPALLIGCLFATVVFLYERSFITSDFASLGSKRNLAVGLRLLIIVVSATATAQPVELMVFGAEINQQLKAQGILEEALRQFAELKEQEELSQQKSQAELEKPFEGTHQQKALSADETTLKDKNESLGQAEAQLKTAEAQRDRAQSSLQRAQQDVERRLRTAGEGDPGLEKARRWVESATIKRDSAQAAVGRAQEQLTRAEGSASAAKVQQEASLKAFNALVETDKEAEAERVARAQEELKVRTVWFRELRNAELGVPVKLPLQPQGQAAKYWDPYRVGLAEKLSVLDDLLHARPPRWPDCSQEDRQNAIAKFGLSARAEQADKAEPRRKELAGSMYRMWLVTYLVALVIPLLTIAFKALMGRELSTYYSTQAQAKAGNPHALQILRAQ